MPREENYLADFYSRMNDTDNWSIDNESFDIAVNDRISPRGLICKNGF